MKALFAHDNRFIWSAGKVWSEGQFGADLWQRYLHYFDELTVVAREESVANPGGSRLTESSCERVRHRSFPDLSNLRSLTIARQRALRQMCELIRDHDAVVARLPSEIGLLAVAAARRLGKPCCVEVVGCIRGSLRSYGSRKAQLYAPLAAARMRSAVRNADHVTYVTTTFLQRRYPTLADNVSSCSDVDVGPIDPAVLPARMARIAALGDRPLTIGLIGTLVGHTKGIEILIQALAQARRQLPSLEVRILGQGDVDARIREAASLGVEDMIKFDGTLHSQELVLKWLDKIDIYIQPSLQEGLPRALIEAMSRGCAAMGSTAGGIPEVLEDEDLVPPGSSAALANLMTGRFADRAWMEDRARRNWNRAKDFDRSSLHRQRDMFWKEFRTQAEAANSGPVAAHSAGQYEPSPA